MERKKKEKESKREEKDRMKTKYGNEDRTEEQTKE